MIDEYEEKTDYPKNIFEITSLSNLSIISCLFPTSFLNGRGNNGAVLGLV